MDILKRIVTLRFHLELFGRLFCITVAGYIICPLLPCFRRGVLWLLTRHPSWCELTLLSDPRFRALLTVLYQVARIWQDHCKCPCCGRRTSGTCRRVWFCLYRWPIQCPRGHRDLRPGMLPHYTDSSACAAAPWGKMVALGTVDGSKRLRSLLSPSAQHLASDQLSGSEGTKCQHCVSFVHGASILVKANKGLCS